AATGELDRISWPGGCARLRDGHIRWRAVRRRPGGAGRGCGRAGPSGGDPDGSELGRGRLQQLALRDEPAQRADSAGDRGAQRVQGASRGCPGGSRGAGVAGVQERQRRLYGRARGRGRLLRVRHAPGPVGPA
ncbi:MAG: hypothetical protein AVDCRST_MAG12-1084, partial [uncultured Rubrobacteraceae bacterium]